MIRTKTATTVLVAVVTLGAASALSAGPLGDAVKKTTTGVNVHGLQESLRYNALAVRADAVIVGTVVGHTVERFVDNAAIGPAGRAEPGYEQSSYNRYELDVERVLVGTLEPTLTVATMNQLILDDATSVSVGGDNQTLAVGETYVLFLSEGTLIWNGHYLILGPQAKGLVSGSTIHFGDERSLTLDELLDRLEEPIDEERDIDGDASSPRPNESQ